ncbi:MAG: hypothetical protein IJT87_07780 [Ruminiclostridium sp.]|nr:hypothetical protein [Ruminiclostridium sp.]
MNTEKDTKRSELDKMVEEILAGTKPPEADNELPDSEPERDANDEAPAEADSGGKTDEAADGTESDTAADGHGEDEADSELAASLGEAIAAIKSEKKHKAELAEKEELPEAPAEITENAEKSENAKEAERPETAEKAENTAKAEKPEKKAKKSKKPKAPEQKPLKPLFGIANIIYSTVIFAAAALAFIFLPRGNVSEIEQRSLATMPEFTPADAVNGGYTNGITEYINDNVPYRDDLKKIGAQMSNLFGVSFAGANIAGPVAVLTSAEEEEEEPIEITTAATTTAAEKTTKASERTTAAITTTEAVTTTSETTAPPETEHIETTKNVNEIAPGVVTNGQVVTQLNDGHWWGISLFGGGKGTRYAACVNKFRELLGDSVSVYSMPVPTAGEYYLPPGYEQYNASHQKSIDSIDEQLVDVISVPASMELWKHVNEPIYTRTDHHWQPLGAYYAAQTFAKTAGVPFADISTMEKVDVPGYVGTMYSFTNDAHILNDPEVFTYYKPTNSYTTYYYDTAYNFTYSLGFFVPMPTGSMYSTFMGADNKIVRIKTDVGNGRKLVVFKDSYGNAEIPFYFGSFEEIWVCDMRYFDLNAIEFVKFTGATDLLFTMCTFSAVGSNAKGLETILNNPVTEIKEGAVG